jgi:hypothetical protein
MIFFGNRRLGRALPCLVIGLALSFSPHFATAMDLDDTAPEAIESEFSPEEWGPIETADIIPGTMKRDVLDYFAAHQSQFTNKKYVSMIDMSAHSSTPRWYLYEVATGAVVRLKVIHGAKSDTNMDGYAEWFSNTVNSNATS